MRILIVGSGAREHALAWALSASPLCEALYCAPGNPGIAEIATCRPIPADALDAQVQLARDERIDFVVVGPEVPLVAGLADRMAAAGIKVFGPSAAAAAIEGSKGFMKDLCRRHGIPTADYRRFTEFEPARAYVGELFAKRERPVVIKTDGLAAGKGVTVAASRAEAEQALADAMVDRRFGAAGGEVVVEEFLEGEEASFFALVDGRTALPFGSAQDHKRVGDGDTGPNTGGMGAYAPAPIMTPAMEARVMDEIVRPTVAALAAEGRPYRGVLFTGLMIGPDGPKLIEFNCRFGDPECQALMLRLKSDLLPALLAAADGTLDHFDVRWRDVASICVVMAAQGYPERPRKGTEIRGLEAAAEEPGVTIFHAGTARRADGALVADGGRVLGVSAVGPDVAAAQAAAYRAIDRIDWPEGFCRRDIGWRVVGRR
jgi:phosphoribosylamine--glycine ligase